MAIEIGAKAPDFTLRGANVEDTFTLSTSGGDKGTVVVFYPFTFTGVCEGELCELRDDIASFESAGVQVVAVSCNAPHAQARWATEQGYQFPVLADFWPHGEVAQAFGVFNEALGCANRATFVIDRDGVVVDTFESADLRTARDKARYAEALAKLG